MTATTQRPTDLGTWVGQGIDRIDGPHKVAGTAMYATDVTLPGMLHAVVVTSTIAAGTVTHIDSSALLTLPGVRAVFTHENFPRLNPPPTILYSEAPALPLQDGRINFHGQEIALVVADTPQQATEGARLIEVTYAAEPPRLDSSQGQPEPLPGQPDTSRGDLEAGWAQAEVRVDAQYTTAENTNNPLGLMGCVAAWEGDRLEIHDTTQGATALRNTLAAMFGVPEAGVRVHVPYLGGGFGAGLNQWPYKAMAAGAARVLGRPVKLALTRPQMFQLVGHRSSSEQHMRLGATRDGRLTMIEHKATTQSSVDFLAVGLITSGTPKLYACPNVATVERSVRINRGHPTSMRAPGEAEGNWAVETAMDELAHELGMDPLELRLRNFSTDVEPSTGLPWSSNALVECCRRGAEMFGWSRRDHRPQSMREGDLLVGWGMATTGFFAYLPVSHARVTMYADGTAAVRSAATDIGTGTYTIITQVAAGLLGLEMQEVDFQLGDSDMPASAHSGGSGLASSLSTAVIDAVNNLRAKLVDLVPEGSPLAGLGPDDVVLRKGSLCRRDNAAIRIAFGDLLSGQGMLEVAADGRLRLPEAASVGLYHAGAFGARFVEVTVDPLIGRLRVRRVASVTDCGRVLNAKLARSQVIGATVGGIGQAMFEDTIIDSTGRVANGTFADYLVAVNADIPQIQVAFVGEPDRYVPSGTKGVGEVGLVGVAAAVGNAVFHATGRRMRDLPITIDKLML